MAYLKAPSDFMRLIATSHDTVGTAAEDLATFVDITPFDSILVVVGLIVTTSVTSVTVKFVHSTASSGSSPVTAKDAAGADLVASVSGAPPPAGTGLTLWIPTRGLAGKFGSPQIATAGAAADVFVAVYGVNPRESAEIEAHWSGSFETAGAAVSETAFS